MSFKVILTDNFKKEAKRLSKKYPSLKIELSDLFSQLEENPIIGTLLGNDVYKIRLAIASKSKGKSGGARIISYVQLDECSVLLLSIYNKGEKNNITDKEILELLKKHSS